MQFTLYVGDGDVSECEKDFILYTTLYNFSHFFLTSRLTICLTLSGLYLSMLCDVGVCLCAAILISFVMFWDQYADLVMPPNTLHYYIWCYCSIVYILCQIIILFHFTWAAFICLDHQSCTHACPLTMEFDCGRRSFFAHSFIHTPFRIVYKLLILSLAWFINL